MDYFFFTSRPTWSSAAKSRESVTSFLQPTPAGSWPWRRSNSTSPRAPRSRTTGRPRGASSLSTHNGFRPEIGPRSQPARPSRLTRRPRFLRPSLPRCRSPWRSRTTRWRLRQRRPRRGRTRQLLLRRQQLLWLPTMSIHSNRFSGMWGFVSGQLMELRVFRILF